MTHYNNTTHTFHIPVMGLAYTIDTPIRLAHFGISSCVSITDDDLCEKMSAYFSKKFNLPYQAISAKAFDHRAQRVKQYLNMVDTIVKQKFEEFKTELAESKASMDKFLEILPNKSSFKEGLEQIMAEGSQMAENVKAYLEKNFAPGNIDVNIMTKVDKENVDEKNNPLPTEFNDAHASLRGFAESELSSSVVLSAGMNPRLYSYFENFADFYPDANGNFKKKIVLKVSDFRSASIQGAFLAKKGLWVSEYRIESGLNCGGHAFATEGLLMGPILEEFTQKKNELAAASFSLMAKALEAKQLPVPANVPEMFITVQGGVGTAEEHNFLMSHYNVDSVGWGSPFLLVPEATAVDEATRKLLADAGEQDLYLSNMSPLGVPFNTVRGTTNDQLKQQRAEKNRYGSACPKKYLALTPGEDGLVCTASRKFQEQKINELLTENDIQAMMEKSCLCVGLSAPALMEKGIPVKGEQQGVVVCPGPNMAYFTEEVSLNRMVRHIYGNDNVITVQHRPHMFIKELDLYVKHLQKEVANLTEGNAQQLKKLKTFKQNLLEGIRYYQNLFAENKDWFATEREAVNTALAAYRTQTESLLAENQPQPADAYICSKQCATCKCQTPASTL
ncbi:hypothetical protein ACLI1A_03515 [Flavobacterium sp. RHBU_3]|uniref:hypothetical protein n=1 Tax=Flavobacterium sp. RHBU_3 TaxID=3391184 RepID=UPI0039847F32